MEAMKYHSIQKNMGKREEGKPISYKVTTQDYHVQASNENC